jgi:hypothetical protein
MPFLSLLLTIQVSKLEKLGSKYNVKIIFTPKYHCETNPIEGYWCHSKVFIRKHTDQTFESLLRLLPISRENFISKSIYLKLFRRFWRTIEAYYNGKTYSEVLKMYFSGLCKENIISHRRITNTNMNDE